MNYSQLTTNYSLNRHIRLLAYNVRSLWNVGSFFRTCDALNVEKLYLTGYTGHPPRKEITKTALGAEETIPWEHAVDPLPILEALKAEGWQIFSLELTPQAVPLHETTAEEKVCLIVGHELSGVPQEMLSLSDETVCIPMLGTKESLNVSVATGIALHHLRFAA
jgi:23S rRNA (guanosine2251-2'-O)-methyltransferase